MQYKCNKNHKTNYLQKDDLTNGWTERWIEKLTEKQYEQKHKNMNEWKDKLRHKWTANVQRNKCRDKQTK